MVMAVEDSVVRVVVRVRPPTPRELESQRRPVVQVVDERVLVFDPEEPYGGFLGLKWGSTHDGPKKKGKDLTFVFDRVFGEAATQQDVFQHTTHSILDSFLQGYNCSGENLGSEEEEPWLVAALPPCFLLMSPASPLAGHLLRRALALAFSVGPHSFFSCVYEALSWAPGYNSRSDRHGSCPLDTYRSRVGEKDTNRNYTHKCVVINRSR